MTKYITSIIVLLFISISAISQDFIYKKDGGRIVADKIEVLLDQTNYAIFGDKSAELFSINNNEISFIAFENGEVSFFEKESRSRQRYNYKKNMINYHLFDLIVNNFKISYERIVAKGKIGIQIPIAFGYGDELSGYDNIDNKFYTGVTLNFYPTGQGKVRYLMGPAIQVGSGNYDDSYSYGNNWDHKTYDTFFLRFLINNGVMFSPIQELSLSVIGSIGIRYIEVTSENYNGIKTVGAFAFNLSYRF